MTYVTIHYTDKIIYLDVSHVEITARVYLYMLGSIHRSSSVQCSVQYLRPGSV